MTREPHYAITPLETWRHFGVLKALSSIALRLLHIQRVALMGRYQRPSGPEGCRVPGIRQVTPDDASLFEAAGFPADLLLSKLAEGPGWILVVDGQLVAWNFYSASHSAIADWLILRSRLQSTIWASGTWVHRDFRGRGLLRQFAEVGDDWRILEGYDEVICWIDMTNHASMRSTQKLGSRMFGQIAVLRWFGLTLVYDGRRLRLGRWTAARPLVLSIQMTGHDRGDLPYEPTVDMHPSAMREN